MIKIITFFVVPFVFLAIGAYWLYFSGWKRGMVQGERVTKAFLSKKIKKILKNEAKIKKSQDNLEVVYLAFDERIKKLEITKKLLTKSVLDVRKDYEENLNVVVGLGAGMASQQDLLKQRLGASGSMLQGEGGSLFSILTGIHFPKPPWS